MKHLSRILAVSLALFVGCAFSMPVQFAPESNAAAIKINKTKATVTRGDTLYLKIKGTDKQVKWSSSKTSVATVTKKGKVTTKAIGKTTITAKVDGKKFKCVVTVKAKKKKKKSSSGSSGYSGGGSGDVWVSGSGTKYHSSPSCSNMRNPSSMSKSEAEAEGYTPCSKCW